MRLYGLVLCRLLRDYQGDEEPQTEDRLIIQAQQSKPEPMRPAFKMIASSVEPILDCFQLNVWQQRGQFDIECMRDLQSFADFYLFYVSISVP